MSTVTLPPRSLPSRVVTTANTVSDMQCEVCAASMTVSPNPYFGTGLAVHRHIAECDGCGAIAFVPEPEAVPGLIEKIVSLLRGLFGTTASA